MGIVGRRVLTALASLLIRWTYPTDWIDVARGEAEREAPEMEKNFDWRERVRSRKGWRLMETSFVEEWMVVGEEILTGATFNTPGTCRRERTPYTSADMSRAVIIAGREKGRA